MATGSLKNCIIKLQKEDEMLITSRARDATGLALLPADPEGMPNLGIPARNGGQKAEASPSPQQPGWRPNKNLFRTIAIYRQFRISVTAVRTDSFAAPNHPSGSE